MHNFNGRPKIFQKNALHLKIASLQSLGGQKDSIARVEMQKMNEGTLWRNRKPRHIIRDQILCLTF